MKLTCRPVREQIHFPPSPELWAPPVFAPSNPRLVNVHLRRIGYKFLCPILELNDLWLALNRLLACSVCKVGFLRFLGGSGGATETHTSRGNCFIARN